MKNMPLGFRNVIVSVAVVVFALGFALPAQAQVVTKVESKCAGKLGKAAAKFAKTIIKGTAKCRAADISGKVTGPCPDTPTQEKIAKAASKAVDSAAKACFSVCSVSSDVQCVADALCPPIVTAGSGAPERCSAGAKNLPFDMGNLGFPGPYCESAIGGPLVDPQDIGQCVATTVEGAASTLVDLIYGSITNASAISADGQKCLAAISKSTEKLASTVAKGVARCRDSILKGKVTGDPAFCQTSDAKLAAKISKTEEKLDAALDKDCNDTLIQELDLCASGVGATLTVADAKACLKDVAREVADSRVVPSLRTYSSVSIIDAAYPPRPVCGDNAVNQLPNATLLRGEECDGTDDSVCPGECLPPGDLFECTCGNVPRIRLFASHELTDADAGWTGDSHDQGVADLSGYITELSNCDCDEMTGAACTGASTDPVCDVNGAQLPTCSWDLFSGTSCDAHGNGDTKNENKDCYICDAFSTNAGAFCVDERDCTAQCYDVSGTATGECSNGQGDCAAGEVCRGQCDRSQSCAIIPNGAPLAVSQGNTSVCAVQRFRTNITGTRDMVTGSHEFNYQLYSIIHLGEHALRPCPVCGGFCEGGAREGIICEGRCTGSADPCRFDVDCPEGETCSEQSPDCPGGSCQLEQICGALPTTADINGDFVAGQPCSIEYVHPLFGAMSNDCLPGPAANITGQGFEVDYLPGTSGTVTLPFNVPCTAQNLGLYDCPCPADGGKPTAPNLCAPACNAPGPNLGVGCATGNSTGDGTKCAGGANGGKLCDEDSDCPLSTCSANPQHCSGDPTTQQFACTTNADCGTGTCGDACPGGRCVPLCLASDDPAAPANSKNVPYEGICAAGPPLYHCDGLTFLTCLQSGASAGCAATCSVSNGPCETDADCPGSETCTGPCENRRDCEAGPDGVLGSGDDRPGGGKCVADPIRNCYLNPLVAEGGSTLNGQGDPDNDFTAVIWCYGKTSNEAVNNVSGFGGPGRVLQKGTNFTNGFTAIP